ncbi:MAG: bifunctional acetaldehyde-CoA/alcohol dehydrogenase [Deltaproteobacteria bacterium]|jgi:acetaldehyde dehydrogenase/alcohol dehydrogenase|nr:bifunctional acetaldehyde-CoA/alcohol dehydrogenase [Deltaproteobacteria bacterium]
MGDKAYPVTDDLESLEMTLERVRAAQRVLAGYEQAGVDRIFTAAAKAANRARIPLAMMAVEETGMGVMEDKVIKNHYAAEYVHNAYRNTITCGVIEENVAAGYKKIAQPMGLIAAVIPTTNPTSTVIFKILICLKTRNGIVISPHPRAKLSSVAAAKILLEAAVAAGAPQDIIGWIDKPSLELTSKVMSEADLILATGGPGMVKAAYSSGKPALGVGSGNVPVIIDESADLLLAVNSIVLSKTFDNGMICASEQAVIALESVYQEVKREFIKRGCYVFKAEELDRARQTIMVNGAVSAAIVGQKAVKIAGMAGILVPEETKILIGEVEKVDLSEEFAHEKLSPVLALYRATDFEEALEKAQRLVEDGGLGHTASLYLDAANQREKIERFTQKLRTCRILVNTPSSHGGIGDLYNFKLSPSLTLGCGTWGGNGVSENVGVKHLLNYKIVAERRENMLWFRTPSKVYMKRGSLEVALEELVNVLGKKRIFCVTDSFLYKNGHLKPLLDKLEALKVDREVFFEVEPDPTLASAQAGAARLKAFEPEAIVALGGGSAMDAAKIMWLLYERPEVDFLDLAMRFMDIRKRVFTYPKLGKKALFMAVPTTAGTGSEVTPFAVITDQTTGLKYPLADYELMPEIAVVDADLQMSAPPGLTAASGIDAAVHSLEAYASMLATPYTDALALGALELIFEHLPAAYQLGAKAPLAREKMADAATMAGMAFANAFLGICHSLAHKLGAFFHLPHGLANALLINRVMKFNASERPTKMGAFPQYGQPMALSSYARLARKLGWGGSSPEESFNNLLSRLDALKAQIGIKASIAEYGIKEDHFMAKIDGMSLAAFDDQCTGANPRYPLVAEIKAIYLEAYYGKGE